VYRNSQRFDELRCLYKLISNGKLADEHLINFCPAASKSTEKDLLLLQKGERVKCSSFGKSFVSFPPEAVNLEVALCV